MFGRHLNGCDIALLVPISGTSWDDRALALGCQPRPTWHCWQARSARPITSSRAFLKAGSLPVLKYAAAMASGAPRSRTWRCRGHGRSASVLLAIFFASSSIWPLMRAHSMLALRKQRPVPGCDGTTAKLGVRCVWPGRHSHVTTSALQSRLGTVAVRMLQVQWPLCAGPLPFRLSARTCAVTQDRWRYVALALCLSIQTYRVWRGDVRYLRVVPPAQCRPLPIARSSHCEKGSRCCRLWRSTSACALWVMHKPFRGSALAGRAG